MVPLNYFRDATLAKWPELHRLAWLHEFCCIAWRDGLSVSGKSPCDYLWLVLLWWGNFWTCHLETLFSHTCHLDYVPLVNHCKSLANTNISHMCMIMLFACGAHVYLTYAFHVEGLPWATDHCLTIRVGSRWWQEVESRASASGKSRSQKDIGRSLVPPCLHGAIGCPHGL